MKTPMNATMSVFNKETKETRYQEVTLSKDEGNRPETTLKSLQSLNPVIEGGSITAGNTTHVRSSRKRPSGSSRTSERKAT